MAEAIRITTWDRALHRPRSEGAGPHAWPGHRREAAGPGRAVGGQHAPDMGSSSSERPINPRALNIGSADTWRGLTPTTAWGTCPVTPGGSHDGHPHPPPHVHSLPRGGRSCLVRPRRLREPLPARPDDAHRLNADCCPGLDRYGLCCPRHSLRGTHRLVFDPTAGPCRLRTLARRRPDDLHRATDQRRSPRPS